MVDASLRVNGTCNLRVIDASIMPDTEPALAPPKVKRARRRRADGEIALDRPCDDADWHGADRRTLETVLRALKAER